MLMEDAGDGHYSWTQADVETFEDRHPIGSKARLAMALIVDTGLRGSDLVQLGKPHRRGDWFHKRQFKGRKRSLVMMRSPSCRRSTMR
jgi:integrase